MANGDLWVKLDHALSPGQQVTAIQEVGGVSSQPGNNPVAVIPLPSPLPTPAFASPVTKCMDQVLLAGLVPGATVTLKLNNTVLAANPVVGTSAWIAFSPAPLVVGARLSAEQAVGGMSSGPSFSMPLAPVPEQENVPTPVIAGPLHACDTAVLASGLIPAGHLDLENGASAQYWVSLAETMWASGSNPLTEGTLVVRQSLPGCGGVSGPLKVPVGPAVAPPAPVLQPFCPDAKRVVVSGLKPGGALTLWSRAANQTAETPIGTIGIGRTTEEVDLPLQIGGSGQVMAIVARQTLCGLTSAPGSSLEFARPDSGALPPPTPLIVAPLVDCMRAVPADGLFNGVLTQVFSVSHGLPLSDLMVMTSPKTRIPVWFPLAHGDKVQIRQLGCSAPAITAVEPVHPLPSPLPPPKVAGPVRPGETAVRVSGCQPGSRVHLLVNWTERAASDQTWDGEAVFHLNSALKENDKLWAVQAMCTVKSTAEGTPTIVAKGHLDLTVTPNSAVGGKAASFTVEARDHDTGAAVPGLKVAFGGAAAGVTGASFAWTMPSSGSSLTGTVLGGTTYVDATFSIALRQAVPLTLNLFPGPVAVPNKAWQTDVVWTVTPRWGDPPVQLKANVGTVMIPPPPGAERRVAVSLAFKAHLQGEIGGIDWPPQVIDLDGYLADVALTGASHALTARFWFQTVDVPVPDDGSETRLAAGAQLFSIT
ncbi:hypothetical protein ACFVTM_20625 [Arthrobacter sp. NPDC058130]|uniref:hypothetical protein n=1 Tax=Arthrobacter sp. NPDC058130 TaxID=3346353 RepID=UPI0036EC1B73